jgi:hypothetical protein
MPSHPAWNHIDNRLSNKLRREDIVEVMDDETGNMVSMHPEEFNRYVRDTTPNWCVGEFHHNQFKRPSVSAWRKMVREGGGKEGLIAYMVPPLRDPLTDEVLPTNACKACRHFKGRMNERTTDMGGACGHEESITHVDMIMGTPMLTTAIAMRRGKCGQAGLLFDPIPPPAPPPPSVWVRIKRATRAFIWNYLSW